MTIDVTPVNDAPSGADNTVTTLEDTDYTFAAADFGFSDATDNPPNAFLAVTITTLPTAGTLTDNGTAVTAGQSITVADITAGLLKFTPAANANGTAYASFTFQVQDDGGTANGGVDLDPSPKTMTVDVTSVNDAPSGTNKTVTTLEDSPYNFTQADFGFSDPNDSPANSLLAVKITTLPTAGSLTNNGAAVTAGQSISLADITAGHLTYTPPANGAGSALATFTFQVQDNGGTANGGVDTDPTPKTMTVSVTSVNDAPVGSNSSVTTPANTAYTFQVSDFPFSDPNDTPANTLLAVKIATLPTSGTLTLSGAAVAAGQAIAVADITAGHLVYQPPSGAAGSPLATFTFQVQDNGGTANGGIDTDPTVRTMTLNVTGNANASLSGFVYVDLNRNSAKDSTEPVLGGILMTLSGTASDGTAVNTTTRTIGDGSYSFTGLAAGTYSISEAQPGALFDGLTAAGSLGGTSGTNLISNISLSEGAAGTGYNFSEAGPSVITINLFLASTPSAQDLYDKLVGFNRLARPPLLLPWPRLKRARPSRRTRPPRPARPRRPPRPARRRHLPRRHRWRPACWRHRATRRRAMHRPRLTALGKPRMPRAAHRPRRPRRLPRRRLP